MLFANNGIWPWLGDPSDDFGVFLRIGSLEVRWYAICIFLGMYLCLLRCKRELARRGIDKDYYDNFFLSVIPIALFGARLWYVISCIDEFKRANFILSFLACLGIEQTHSGGFHFALAGLAIQGGVLFGVIWGFVYYKFINKRYPVGLHFDLVIPSIFIGQILGRWGNFFNGEVYGKMVSRKSLWFIPRFIIDNCTLASLGSQAGQSNVHIPLFYIEGLFNLVGYILIGFVIWRFWKKYRKPFCVSALYFIYYGIVRLCLEGLRIDKYQMGTSKQMSIAFIIIGVALFVFAQIYYRKVPYEKIYINEEYENELAEIKRLEDEKLQKEIELKKKEIRARRAKEKNG